MPSNLNRANPSGVLPKNLCIQFSEVRVFPLLSQSYHDGTQERSLIQDGVNPPRSLRTWSLRHRIKSTDLEILKAFFFAKRGQPFFYYDPYGVVPGQQIGGNWDASGSNTQGRVTVVFMTQQWEQRTDLARTEVSLEIKEVD